jgi:hypothetical protein
VRNFLPALNCFEALFKEAGDKKYSILTILTAGDPKDLKEFGKKLEDLAEFPCSVLIIEVGQGNFKGLKNL